MVGRFQWLSNGAAGARHVVPKHRCLQNPANPHMTSASQRSGNARVTAQSSHKVAAQTSPHLRQTRGSVLGGSVLVG